MITELDLVNPSEDLAEIAGMILKGQTLLNATEVNLDLSNLVPLIAGLSPEPGSEHTFVLNMSDNNGNSFEKQVVFIYSGSAE